MTQFAGTTYTQGSLSQDGVAPGAFTGISITTAGDVVANYNNGEAETVAQVPITTFAAPDALRRVLLASSTGPCVAPSWPGDGRPRPRDPAPPRRRSASR